MFLARLVFRFSKFLQRAFRLAMKTFPFLPLCRLRSFLRISFHQAMRKLRIRAFCYSSIGQQTGVRRSTSMSRSLRYGLPRIDLHSVCRLAK